jgi:sensor histidine kinase regulating citrate/malate metabolism
MKYENRAMKAEQEIAVKLIKAQENYYKALLKKEEQTRAFRHDYRNHLYCMKALSDNNEFVKLREYINELNKSQNEIHTLNTSGDKLVDVIINELMNNHPSVKLKLFGAFDDNQVVEQVDMCTIFSNLLANAFEEAEKSTDKTVRLHIKRLKANLFICIQNSVCKMPIIENNEIKTSKSGAGHGYGLKNVKMSLDKYNGLLELKCENNIFEANILIPNVIKDEHV